MNKKEYLTVKRNPLTLGRGGSTDVCTSELDNAIGIIF